MIKSIYIIVIALFCFNSNGLFAQNPASSNDINASEARKHFNKAKVFVENASTEKEWELAINELEQVIKYAPNNDKAYLMLGDAYSHIMTKEAIQQAQKHWSKYVELVPSSKNEIEEKIATLEALYDITRSRKQQAIVESLLGFWFPSYSPSLDSRNTSPSVSDPGDIEFFMQGGKLLLRYVSYNENYRVQRTSIMEPYFEGDNLMIEYTHTFIWTQSPPYNKSYHKYSYNIDLNLPAIDQIVGKSIWKDAYSGKEENNDIVLKKKVL